MSSKSSPDYAAARREWLERYGDYIAQARNWRTFAFVMVLVSAAFCASTIYEAQRVKVLPYVIAVDKLGESVRLAQAVQSGALQRPVVTHILSNWLLRVRERIGDVNAEKAVVLGAYDYLTQSSTQSLNDYFAHSNPYEAADPNSSLGSRTVEISSALPLGTPTATGGTYQVTWTERSYDKTGALSNTQRYVGNITYSIVNPKKAPSAAELLSNPFGIYITSFQWQKSV